MPVASLGCGEMALNRPWTWSSGSNGGLGWPLMKADRCGVCALVPLGDLDMLMALSADVLTEDVLV